jgi:hypothetical protein
MRLLDGRRRSLLLIHLPYESNIGIGLSGWEEVSGFFPGESGDACVWDLGDWRHRREIPRRRGILRRTSVVMTTRNGKQRTKRKKKRASGGDARFFGYAEAADLPLKKASKSALITSFRVEHMPWGPPGMTL